MISFDEALAVLIAQVRPLSAESVPLDAAAGRVLAAPCVAQVDAPWADISTMDGYAVRDADLADATPLRLIGTAFPGTAYAGAVGQGECVRVFTGAAIPSGADRVVIQEDMTREADLATVTGNLSGKSFIRPHGSDFRVGDVLLESGRLLSARALVAAAGADVAELSVWRRPRLVVLGTGDELAEPGFARNQAGSIPESVSFGVAAFGAAWGAELVGRQRLPDDVAAMTTGAAVALEEADVVVVTGGASVGDKDYAKRVFGNLGTEILFSRIAIMPGKPVWFGRRGSTWVLGLPGNPSSAMVTARLFLVPLLAGLTGRDPAAALRWRAVRLFHALPAAGDRETFVRARDTADGALPIDNQDSGMQRALADADVLIRRAPQSPAAAAGSTVAVIDF